MRHGARGDAVVPAVEVAGEADHFRLAGEGARQPQGEVRGFRAGTREAHALSARDQPIDELRPPHLQLVRGAPVGAERRLLANGFEHGRVAMAQEEGAVPAEVIDVLVAVDVPLARSGSARGIDRIGQQGAAVVGEAGRNHFARALVKLGRAARARPVLGFDLRVGPRRRHRLGLSISHWPPPVDVPQRSGKDLHHRRREGDLAPAPGLRKRAQSADERRCHNTGAAGTSALVRAAKRICLPIGNERVFPQAQARLVTGNPMAPVIEMRTR